jgi:hypothetical protein
VIKNSNIIICDTNHPSLLTVDILGKPPPSQTGGNPDMIVEIRSLGLTYKLPLFSDDPVVPMTYDLDVSLTSYKVKFTTTRNIVLM